MNEYTKVRNAHDRAMILAQLVNADARAMHAAAIYYGDTEDENGDGLPPWNDIARRYAQSRAELWKLVGPAEEDATDEA